MNDCTKRCCPMNDGFLKECSLSSEICKYYTPTIPAIPLDRIKQLREDVDSLASDYIDNNDDDVAAFADSTLCMFDNMIKEYSDEK